MSDLLSKLGLFFLAAVLSDVAAGTGLTDALATIIKNAVRAGGAFVWEHLISQALLAAPEIARVGIGG